MIEAINKAIRLLIEGHELSKIRTGIESIKEDMKSYPEPYDIVESIYEKEDR